MNTTYSQSMYHCILSNMMHSMDKNVYWNGGVKDDPTSFVGIIQLYHDITAKTLKSNAIVAHPVHIMLLNFTNELCRFFIDHGNTLVGLRPFSTFERVNEQDKTDDSLDKSILLSVLVVPFSSVVAVTAHRDAREGKWKVLREATRKNSAPSNLTDPIWI